MAIQNISYTNKSYINQNADTPVANKVTDADMNEIKSVVNNNASELSNLANQFGDFIIEEGGDISTNFYIKYNSGLLVQYGQIQITQAITTAMGSAYRTANTTQKNLVIDFVDTDYSVTLTANPALNSAYIGLKATDNFTIWAICYNSTAAATRYVDFMAIGRWK